MNSMLQKRLLIGQFEERICFLPIRYLSTNSEHRLHFYKLLLLLHWSFPFLSSVLCEEQDGMSNPAFISDKAISLPNNPSLEGSKSLLRVESESSLEVYEDTLKLKVSVSPNDTVTSFKLRNHQNVKTWNVKYMSESYELLQVEEEPVCMPGNLVWCEVIVLKPDLTYVSVANNMFCEKNQHCGLCVKYRPRSA